MLNFPRHWGNPPDIQTQDMFELPGGYGSGSSTLRGWIREKLESDRVQRVIAEVEGGDPTNPGLPDETGYRNE